MASSSPPPLILVTGASGFIGGVVAAYALAAGYRVRAAVRDPANPKCMALRALSGPAGGLELVAAELDSPAGWAQACAGATFILHVASPVPVGVVKDVEAEVIRPAIAGNLNVLAAAAATPTVARVVIISSMSAVSEGRTAEWPTHIFTEQDWSDTTQQLSPYATSKTKAEQAAWAFMNEAPRHFDIVTLCPSFVMGPPATNGTGSSIQLFVRLFDWSMLVAVATQNVCVFFWSEVGSPLLRQSLTARLGGRLTYPCVLICPLLLTGPLSQIWYFPPWMCGTLH